MIKLSIITPFYNTIRQTKQLANILLKQLTAEVEWIIIDDGTNESELDTLGVKVIHIANNSGTASVPRNVGLDNALGKYIVFVDSDDEVTENYIETIINKIDSEDFDYCYFGWKTKDYDYPIEEEPQEWNTCVWNCIYKKEIIGNNRFNPKIYIGEDSEFNKLVRKGKRSNIKDILYIYKWNERNDNLSSLHRDGLIPRERE